MPDVVVRGAEQLAEVTKRLKTAGDHGKGIRKEMLKAIRNEAKPTVKAVRDNTSILPQRGGLARKIRTGIGVRTKTAGDSVGVRIVGKNQYSVEAINSGRLRHPLFGDREHWYEQRVKPGWFTNPIEKRAKQLRKDLLRVIDETRRKIEE